MSRRAFFILASLGLLTACSDFGDTLLGLGPDPARPQLLRQASGIYDWSSIAHFGLVPDALARAGQAYCDQRRPEGGPPLRAIGYHPRTLNMNGDPMLRGGYVCARF